MKYILNTKWLFLTPPENANKITAFQFFFLRTKKMNQYTQLEITTQGVGIVWLNQQNSKVNVLSPAMIQEYETLMQILETEENIKAIVLISSKKDFIAGADLEAILPISKIGEWEPISRKAHALLNRMAQCPKPVVAAIQGGALGGGLEVALACHYRIASNHPSTVFALPEVKLGLLPGGGGTQRLPALVGLQKALEIMLTGKNIYASQALKMGLIDKLVNQYALLPVACEIALSMVNKKIIRPKKQNFLDKLLENNFLGQKIILKKAYQKTLELTHGNYPAPFKILECVEIGLKHGIEAGIEAEVQNFDELVVNPVSKQLIRLFFAMNEKKKNPYTLPKPIQNLTIVGAGFMGAGIAQVSINKNMQISLKDINTETLANAKKQIFKALNKKVKKKVISAFDAETTLNQLHTTTSYQNTQIQHADIVIEAVFENIDLKQKVLAECEQATNPNTIFATNTSALPIARIAQHAQRPQNVIGMHYFSPVPQMPLLEIVAAPNTSQQAKATAFEIGILQGKTCIVVNDSPGFYTTRILSVLLNEALLLLDEGGDILQIDAVARQIGFPVGPITLIDEVGIDVGAHIMSGDLTLFFEQRHPQAHAEISRTLAHIAKAGYCGKKNAKGFYAYNKKTGKKIKNTVDPHIYDFFGTQERTYFDEKVIRRRLLLSMVNEAVSCLADNTISTPLDGDIGAVFGLGFPPFTGGPFRYLDTISCEKALSRLHKLQQSYGNRFTPCPLLVQYAHENKLFYNELSNG